MYCTDDCADDKKFAVSWQRQHNGSFLGLFVVSISSTVRVPSYVTKYYLRRTSSVFLTMGILSLCADSGRPPGSPCLVLYHPTTKHQLGPTPMISDNEMCLQTMIG
jgi:hypothetical protein